MRDMIYGIGPHPDAEDDQFESPSYVVYITDLGTWEKEQCCSDWTGKDSYNDMIKAGFVELQDAIWEPTDMKMRKEYIHISMSVMGFVHNESFEKFMIDV